MTEEVLSCCVHTHSPCDKLDSTYQHFIGINDGLQSMRDGQDSAALEVLSDCILNDRISAAKRQTSPELFVASDLLRTTGGKSACCGELLLVVHVGCGLVDDEYFAASENGSREADELLLSDAEVASRVVHLRVQPAGHREHLVLELHLRQISPAVGPTDESQRRFGVTGCRIHPRQKRMRGAVEGRTTSCQSDRGVFT